ncbi:Activating signal cointegrator 1 [Liparis tanakae]|uniref:Activating signal cointegrator 1 n=1 Tax=Liparis tanakae TaxID=230148 RepID=A0A4Z2HGB7_9TELE|nr:Activating signal cointegrator 1 [Liparis tanakae]
MYRHVYKKEPRFPKEYPTGCLLGCVNVNDCLPQEQFTEQASSETRPEAERYDDSALALDAPTRQQYNHEYLPERGRTGETESERLSASAGSEITNSIVLGWMTCLLSNFLLATSEGRKVWREERGEASLQHHYIILSLQHKFENFLRVQHSSNRSSILSRLRGSNWETVALRMPSV